ncbi:hypothetical protein LguiA_000041 [Lonicera macranthoides]
MGGRNSSGVLPLPRGLARKSKSWPLLEASPDGETRGRKMRVAPEGCFSVYVGPQKERFVIKTEYVNHPLFKVLLEEAELEYGYNCEGPLALPCNVDFFVKVLVEMDGGDVDDEKIVQQGCSFRKTCRTSSSYRLLP